MRCSRSRDDLSDATGVGTSNEGHGATRSSRDFDQSVTSGRTGQIKSATDLGKPRGGGRESNPPDGVLPRVVKCCRVV